MFGWTIAGAGAIVLLDQGTKALAVRYLAPGGTGAPRVLRLAAGGGRVPTVPALLGLWVVTLACTALVAAAAAPSHRLATAGLAVALAGATGNLVDRVGRGAIVDFIALGWWPTFNLADVAIVAGVAVAIGSVV